jgi:drug/metabolite transporter (DMT)-like permease
MSREGASSPPAAGRSTLVGVAFSLGAAVAYGTSQVLTRQGVGQLAPPLVGSFIALGFGTLGFALLSMRSLGRRGEHFWRGAVFFAGAGVFSATGVLLLFIALSRGPVVVISPIVATNPLFTLVMAAVLLRGVERITRRVALGALLVVGGVVVLTVL